MKKILLIVFLLFSFKVFASPSNTMSITPVAVASATIEADDENTRNNAISTTYNAHSHTDISSAATNDFTIGDGQTSNKSFSVDNADASNPALRYNDSSDVWEVSNDGVTFTEIITDAGTQSLAGTKTFTDLIATTINAGTVDATIGATTPANGTFTTLIGTNIDGIIGVNTPAAGTFTTLETTGLLTVTGGQIKFPASQSASADANTLDDYEEGTWTVVATLSTSGSVTVIANDSPYVKIGKTVYVHSSISVNAVSSPVGDIRFSLPFVVADLAQAVGSGAGALALHNANFVTSGWIVAEVREGTSYFVLRATNNNSAWTSEAGTIFNGDESMSFQLVYTTND